QPTATCRWKQKGIVTRGSADGDGEREADQRVLGEGYGAGPSCAGAEIARKSAYREGRSYDHRERKRISHPHRSWHADGRVVTAILDPGLSIVGAGGGWRPAATDAARREADRVSRQRRQDRRFRSSLPASLRLAVFWPQRGR